LRHYGRIVRAMAPQATDDAPAAVSAALDLLSVRQREIVRRCESGDETQAQVAASLGISRRHLIRERNVAMGKIACALVQHPSPSGTQTHPVDTLQAQFSIALTLEHNGSWRQAAEVLERLEVAVIDPLIRSEIILRLVRLYVHSDRLSLAEKKITDARRLAVAVEAVHPWLSAEIDVANARLSDATGDLTTAEKMARHAAALLRSWTTHLEPRVGAALLDALTLQGEIILGKGEMEAARAIMTDIQRLLDQPIPADVSRIVDAGVIAAMTTVFSDKNDESGEEALWRCYSFALDHGLTRQGTLIAANLAAVLRLHGKRAAALSLLEAMLPIARGVQSSLSLGSILVELVHARSDCADVSTALTHVGELKVVAQSNPYMLAYAHLLDAKLQLRRREFAAALQSAEIAESLMMRLGKVRITGMALQIQGLALAALGHRNAAVRVMQLAIDHQHAKNHPHRLAEAQRAMASITGAASHL
jgi:predicted DNA-binding protein (UPF0251 family)